MIREGRMNTRKESVIGGRKEEKRKDSSRELIERERERDKVNQVSGCEI